MVFRSPVKCKNSYIDLNALDTKTSGFGTMVTGRWISLALLLCHIIFSFCYLTSKSSSPWNLTPLFCCLLTRYTKILYLKSACPCLPCFAGYPNPTKVQHQRQSSTLYLHIKKDKFPNAYFYIVPFRPPPSSQRKKKDRKKERPKEIRNKQRNKETEKERKKERRKERNKPTKKQRKKDTHAHKKENKNI